MCHEQQVHRECICVEENVSEGVVDRRRYHDGKPGQNLRQVEGEKLTQSPFPAASQNHREQHDPEADPLPEKVGARLVEAL